MFTRRDELLAACSPGYLARLQHLLQPTQEIALQQAETTIDVLFCRAALDHQVQIAKYCLECGAKIGGDVKSIIMRCCDPEILALAALHGYPIGYSPGQGLDAPTIAISYGNEGHIDTVRWLLENGLDPNQGGLANQWNLAIAAQKGNLEVGKLLISYGANIDDSAALLVAAERGRQDCVRFLLAQGANPDNIGSYFEPAHK